jgi:hypothetical protein
MSVRGSSNQSMLKSASSREERQAAFACGADDFVGGERYVVRRARSDEQSVAGVREELGVNLGRAYDANGNVGVSRVDGVANGVECRPVVVVDRGERWATFLASRGLSRKRSDGSIRRAVTFALPAEECGEQLASWTVGVDLDR